jgi:hypothetical protein
MIASAAAKGVSTVKSLTAKSPSGEASQEQGNWLSTMPKTELALGGLAVVALVASLAGDR